MSIVYISFDEFCQTMEIGADFDIPDLGYQGLRIDQLFKLVHEKLLRLSAIQASRQRHGEGHSETRTPIAIQ
jgi:hypothetical protein